MAEDPLQLLCVEPRFPGRLGGVADWLVRKRGYRCQFYCTSADPEAFWPASVGKGLEIVPFSVGGVARDSAVQWTRDLERRLCYAFGLYEALEARRPRPVDLILGRSASLGSTLYAPVHLARCPVVNLFDYFLPTRTGDLADLKRDTAPPEYAHWRRAANAGDLLDLENATSRWTPTEWQRDTYPPEYRRDFFVQFDGVDARQFSRSANEHRQRTVSGQEIGSNLRVVTFVASSLDQVRGFDRFVTIANRLLTERKDVAVIVAGDRIVKRGLDVDHFRGDFKEKILSRTPLVDPSRCWFLNQVPSAITAEVLTASDLHLHPSRSYPAARSLVEAMAAGCTILAADTPSVREFITPGETGLLADGDDVDEWVRLALGVLGDVAGHRALGEAAARRARERYDREVTLPRLARHFDGLV